jgi:transcriptional regulator of acetoin/glycerol metabolism
MSKIAEEEEFNTFWEKMQIIKEAWSGYIEGGLIPPEDVIRPEVLASWMRCKANGLDPYHINISSIVPRTVTQRLAANRDLISITAYFFDAYADLLGDKVFAMDLYDRDLYLIKTFGTSMIAQQRKEHAKIGAFKDESVAGTTAMGLAKRTGKPWQLIGAEHYDVNLHGRVCTAIPVFSARREFWGVINVVQNSTPSSKYTFETMIALSKGLESLVQQAEKQRQLEAANALTRTILEEIDSAIFVVDPNSCIKEVNTKAKEIMDPPVSPVGKSVVDCFGINNPFSRVLTEQKAIDNKEITLQTNGERKHYIATIRPIFYQQGKLWGVLGTLDNLETTRKLMRNIVGWKAVFSLRISSVKALCSGKRSCWPVRRLL